MGKIEIKWKKRLSMEQPFFYIRCEAGGLKGCLCYWVRYFTALAENAPLGVQKCDDIKFFCINWCARTPLRSVGCR